MPIRIGSLLVLIFVLIMLFTNSYRLIEKWIIAFVSIIGLSFIYELSLVTIDWPAAAYAWVTPSFPQGSMVIIMSVLGAVVMPHNLFLHSEIIQSRQWNLSDEKMIKKQLRYEYVDTILSMVIGWAINSAMIHCCARCWAIMPRSYSPSHCFSQVSPRRSPRAWPPDQSLQACSKSPTTSRIPTHAPAW